eukprot:TRINITY_DN1670_c0_g1_i2.p1 TRINITY_DN1670_c0_g1~~TRINITY_DN1670_c0_g1_i2.p1  ORF type:complete len:707 (+),score=173.96 TRINITY_DN1670_c0_g1_i2:1837-3957(+)
MEPELAAETAAADIPGEGIHSPAGAAVAVPAAGALRSVAQTWTRLDSTKARLGSFVLRTSRNPNASTFVPRFAMPPPQAQQPQPPQGYGFPPQGYQQPPFQPPAQVPFQQPVAPVAAPAPAPAKAKPAAPAPVPAPASKSKGGAAPAPAPAPAAAAPKDAGKGKKSAPSAQPAAAAPAAAKPVASTPEKWDEDSSGPTPPAATPATVPAPTAAASSASAAETSLEDLLEGVDDVDDTPDPEEKEHLNIVFIGHVDAGKSTIGGHLLLLTGMVDERTIEKYKRVAKDKNRESWWLAFVLDSCEEERAKGKTVEVGRAFFETATKKYTILDAPGHKSFVPNMIGGASQADVGVLVISARKGELETGFDRGGQTREHAMLAKTLGVRKLIVVINKMDTYDWGIERFQECEGKIAPYLKQIGYNVQKDVTFIPVSGLGGENLKDRVPASLCPWYKGPSLLEAMDSLQAFDRNYDASLRMPVVDKYKDMGTVILMGKIESGRTKVGDKLVLMPNKTLLEVVGIEQEETQIKSARAGDNVRIRVQGVKQPFEETDVHTGFVLCGRKNQCPVVDRFIAQVQLMELLDHKPIFSAGYTAVIHIHNAVEECSVTELLATVDKKTLETSHTRPRFVKGNTIVVTKFSLATPMCVELFSNVPQMGRFTLRDEGKTIGIGRIIRVPDGAAQTPAPLAPGEQTKSAANVPAPAPASASA